MKYFITVAEELNFRRAAQRLNMAQPPLSRRIKNLEEETGTPLFNRTNRSVRLTWAGNVLLKKAREIVEKAEDTLDSLSRIGAGDEGYLSIGFNEPAINTFLSRVIKRFHSRYPGVKLLLKEMQTNEQLEALREDRIKIGFIRFFRHDVSGLNTSLIYSENYLLAIPKGHALGKYSKLPLALLKQQPLIIFPRRMNPGLYNYLMKQFENAGFKPSLTQEAVTKQTTLALVEAGVGIAIVPESSMSIYRKGVEFRPLSDELPPIEIYAVWKESDKSAALMNFVKAISVPPKT